MKKEYTDTDRRNDFDFFLSHYDEYYKKYGHCCIAIRYNEILGGTLWREDVKHCH